MAAHIAVIYAQFHLTRARHAAGLFAAIGAVDHIAVIYAFYHPTAAVAAGHARDVGATNRNASIIAAVRCGIGASARHARGAADESIALRIGFYIAAVYAIARASGISGNAAQIAALIAIVRCYEYAADRNAARVFTIRNGGCAARNAADVLMRARNRAVVRAAADRARVARNAAHIAVSAHRAVVFAAGYAAAAAALYAAHAFARGYNIAEIARVRKGSIAVCRDSRRIIAFRFHASIYVQIAHVRTARQVAKQRLITVRRMNRKTCYAVPRAVEIARVGRSRIADGRPRALRKIDIARQHGAGMPILFFRRKRSVYQRGKPRKLLRRGDLINPVYRLRSVFIRSGRFFGVRRGFGIDRRFRRSFSFHRRFRFDRRFRLRRNFRFGRNLRRDRRFGFDRRRRRFGGRLRRIQFRFGRRRRIRRVRRFRFVFYCFDCCFRFD